jgi:hypothetical protein
VRGHWNPQLGQHTRSHPLLSGHALHERPSCVKRAPHSPQVNDVGAAAALPAALT